MNDKEWEELLKARFEELRTAIQDLNLIDFDNLECRDAVRSIVGVKLDERNFHLMSLAMALNERRGEGSMTLDEVVTHLNNLPLGLRIAELQRAEVLEAEPELAEALETETTNDNSPMKKEHWEHFVNLKPNDYNYEDLDSDADFFKAEVAPDAKSLEQLCDEYEVGLVEGKHAPEAVAYIMALEDLVSEMQGKSFTDSSRISTLESKLESFENLKHEHEEQLKHNRIVRVENGRLESENEELRQIVSEKALKLKSFDNQDAEHERLPMNAVEIGEHRYSSVDSFKSMQDSFLRSREGLLRKLVSRHIPDWDKSLSSLKDRVCLVNKTDSVTETVVIDGKTVAYIYDVNSQVEGVEYFGLIPYKEITDVKPS